MHVKVQLCQDRGRQQTRLWKCATIEIVTLALCCTSFVQAEVRRKCNNIASMEEVDVK